MDKEHKIEKDLLKDLAKQKSKNQSLNVKLGQINSKQNHKSKEVDEFVEHFHLVMENIHLIAIQLDNKGKILYCNQYFCEVTGFKKEEIPGKNWFKMFIPAEYSEIKKEFQKGLKKAAIIKNFRSPVLTKSGIQRLIEWNNTLMLDPEGNVIGTISIGTDITERKQAEEKLRESEDGYRDLIENSSDLICTHDLDGNILSINNAALKITGYSKEEILKGNLRSIIVPEYQRFFDVYLKRIEKSGEARGTMIIKTRTGEKRIWEYNNTLRKDGIARPIVRGMVRDVTEQKRAELEGRVLYEINNGITSTPNLNELLKLIHESISKVVYAENFFVALYNKETELFSFPYFIDKFDQTPEPMALQKSCTAYVFRKGKPLLLTSDVCQQLEAQNEVELIGAPSMSWIGVPLKTPDRTIGVLVLQHYEEENAYSTRDVQFLGSVGNQIALVIERKMADDELRESEEMFRRLFDESADPILLLDESGFTSCNPATISLLRYTSKEEFLNKKPWELSPERQPDGLLSTVKAKMMIDKAMAEGYNRFEWIHTRSDGSDIPVEVMLTPIQLKGKMYLYTIWRDISERYRSERELKESELRMRMIVEGTPYLFFYIQDKDAKVTYISPSVKKITGYSVDEWLNQSHWFITNNPTNNKAKEITRVHLSGKFTDGPITIELLHADGHIILLEIYENPIIINGVVAGLQGVAHDITERKRAEVIIHQKNQQLQEINATKDKFFSIIAHDLRNPFHGFLSLTKMLAEDADTFSPGEISKIGKDLYKSANNIFSLLKNLLEWAQMQKGSNIFKPEELSISDLIAQNVKAIMDMGRQKGIVVINKVTESIHAFADEKMVNSVLSNLLWNAVKFTNKNGTVSISCRKIENEMIEISVRDTGMGIGRDIVEKLFTVGEKINRKGTEGEPSTGLGLLLCKEFVEKHGGKIWAESEEGVGSTFYFTLRSHG